MPDPVLYAGSSSSPWRAPVPVLIRVQVFPSLESLGHLCLTFCYFLLSSSSQAKLFERKYSPHLSASTHLPLTPQPHCSLAFASMNLLPKVTNELLNSRARPSIWSQQHLDYWNEFRLFCLFSETVSPLDFSCHDFLPSSSIILRLHGRLRLFAPHFRCQYSSEFCPRILAFLFCVLIH